MLVVTTNDLPGYRVVKHLGIVRGLTVRSRSVIGNIGAAVQIFFGGNITLYTKLAEETRPRPTTSSSNTRRGWAPTPFSPCATMPTRSLRQLRRFWPMGRPWWSSRRPDSISRQFRH